MLYDVEKFKGVIPALYACYDDAGNVSKERTVALSQHLYEKGVNGLYVGGSSGECILQTLDERLQTLEYVAEAFSGKLTLIAHVGSSSTRDSIALAEKAEALGYDAISAIPPIYYALPDHSVERYWTDIMEATELPFIIYNIPQTTGYTLTIEVFKRMIDNPKVIGVKSSSMPVMDIERFREAGGDNVIVYNGSDEQFIAGRVIGAAGGIGGTYGAMPELFLQANEFLKEYRLEEARELQHEINNIIMLLTSQNGHMYSVIKQILQLQGVDVGGVRLPLEDVPAEDLSIIEEIHRLIEETVQKYNHIYVEGN